MVQRRRAHEQVKRWSRHAFINGLLKTAVYTKTITNFKNAQGSPEAKTQRACAHIVDLKQTIKIIIQSRDSSGVSVTWQK